MDELKLKLSTRFMRGIVAKLMTKLIYKKCGYKVDIHINDLDITVIDGDTTIKLNAEAKVDNKEFMNIIKNIGLD